MKPCKEIRRSFVNALYNELNEEEKKDFKEHLQSCQKCRRAFRKMKQTLNVMSTRTRPEPPAQFWEGYYDKLEQRMQREKKASAFQWKQWALRAAAVILLIGMGVILGRMGRVGPETNIAIKPTLSPVPVAQAKLQQRTQDFLGRSEILLLGIVNFDPSKQDPAALDIDRQKQISGDLIHEATYLKKELSNTNDRRLEKLVGDLELILLQIKNLEEKEDLPEIELVKSGVDRKGLLLKINLEQMRSHSSPSQKTKGASGKSGI
jgi:hypothetical protein